MRTLSLSNGKLSNQKNLDAGAESKPINQQDENENKRKKLDEKKNCNFFQNLFN